uniref:ATP synthase complex subunit 8 n=1 Tax=Cantharidae sp. GENSP01 TaxID=1205542 RepID=A0A0S2MSB6_9COLE|nr:ATP synthase F0 subunit 8 [Cantharidae sp. GENSP01]
MPQMAPLSWLNLFITTVWIFMIINSLNYFTFTAFLEKKSFNKMKNKNWKW